MSTPDSMVRSALLRLKYVDSHKYSEQLLWAAATDLLGIGSTLAHEVCRQHGLDPNEKLPQSSMNKVIERCGKEMDDMEQGPSETCCKMWAVLEECSTRY